MKIIPNFEDYLACENGTIFSTKSHKLLTDCDNGNGYRKVVLWVNGKSHQEYIHRLLAITFLENPKNHRYVDHIDRNKRNNNITNLRWVSAKENTDNLAGRARYSVSKKGQGKHELQLIAEIQIDYKEGMTVMEISRKYQIPRQSVSRFIKGILRTKY